MNYEHRNSNRDTESHPYHSDILTSYWLNILTQGAFAKALVDEFTEALNMPQYKLSGYKAAKVYRDTVKQI